MLSAKSNQELLQLSRRLIPPLSAALHKGQAGKIGVFGGCEDYTGAPFFAAHSAALVGADLSHVVCERQAASVIKGYLPDLMVHPYLFSTDNPAVERFALREVWDKIAQAPLAEALESREVSNVVEQHILPKVMGLVSRLDAFVVGPGFGRDPLMLHTLMRVVEEIRVANKPVVVDADALFLVAMRPGLVRGNRSAVLTPNVVEFSRLCDAVGVECGEGADAARALLRALGGVVVVRKGAEEVIARDSDDGAAAGVGAVADHVVSDARGLLRRVGGQGDTLAGAIGTMLIWARARSSGSDTDALVACFAACTLVRVALAKAFAKYHRAMQTLNVHEFLGEAYVELFGDCLEAREQSL